MHTRKVLRPRGCTHTRRTHITRSTRTTRIRPGARIRCTSDRRFRRHTHTRTHINTRNHIRHHTRHRTRHHTITSTNPSTHLRNFPLRFRPRRECHFHNHIRKPSGTHPKSHHRV